MKIDDQDKITHLKLKCLSSKYHHLAKTCRERGERSLASSTLTGWSWGRKFVSFYVRRTKDNLDDVKMGGRWC